MDWYCGRCHVRNQQRTQIRIIVFTWHTAGACWLWLGLVGAQWFVHPGHNLTTCPNSSWSNATITVLQFSTRFNHSQDYLLKDVEDVSYYDVGSTYQRWYCSEHGYKYVHVVIPKTKASAPHHLKPVVAHRHLHTTDVLIMIDFDAIINLYVDLRCLLDHWNFTRGSSAVMLMPYEPPGKDFNWMVHPVTKEKYQVSNTGFIVLKNDPRASDILKAWWNAFVTHKNVEKRWVFGGYQDQSFFNKYVRPTVEPGRDIILVDCNDANGMKLSPMHRPAGWRGEQCDGKYVMHFWGAKMPMRKWLTEVFTRGFMNAHSKFGEMINHKKLPTIGRERSVRKLTS